MTTYDIINILAVSMLIAVVGAASLFYYYNYNRPEPRKPAAIRVRVDNSRRRAGPPPTSEEQSNINEVDIMFWLLVTIVSLLLIVQQF
jgi:hypothetical protein